MVGSSVTHTNLELSILLPQPRQCWNYMHALSSWVISFLFKLNSEVIICDSMHFFLISFLWTVFNACEMWGGMEINGEEEKKEKALRLWNKGNMLESIVSPADVIRTCCGMAIPNSPCSTFFLLQDYRSTLFLCPCPSRLSVQRHWVLSRNLLGFAGKDLVLHIKGTQETAEPELTSILPSRGLEMEWVWDNHVGTVLWKVRGLRICPSDSTVLLHAAQQPQATTVLWLAKGSSVFGLIFIGILLIIPANLNIWLRTT